jgi:5-amino-6-(5-phosphoribosylamino)uracil reductase
MSVLRLLLPGTAMVGDLATNPADAVQALADLYAYPDPVPATGWVRATMLSTLDGAVTGADGRSGSISSPTDRAVFSVLRGLADVVLVGAGTVRAEGYLRPRPQPEFTERRAAAGQAPAPRLAVVTTTGRLGATDTALGGPDGAYVITCARADLDRLRAVAGADRVLVAGQDRVDAQLAVTHLAARGLRRILLEGGPHLLGDTIAADCLDEICLTLTPLLVAGDAMRIALGPASAVRTRLAHLAECDATLLGRWLVQRS